MAILKICPNCEQEFKTYPSINQKCCTRKCRDELTKKLNYDKYKKICLVCESEFLPPRQAEGGIFCSYKCRGISDRKDRVDRNGYWYICIPDHVNANKQSYVPEHHLVVEESIGRCIESHEVVHHINHNKKDNRLENLQVMTISRHSRLHILDSHKKGKISTLEQRKRASDRMKIDNPNKYFQIRKEGGACG